MSLRALALELYSLERRVEELTRLLAVAFATDRSDIELELLRATAQRDQLRAVLQAKKDLPPNLSPRR